MRAGSRPTAVAAVALLGLAACGSSTASGSDGPSPTADPLNGSITVFAASSLTTTFNGAEAALESHNPGFKAEYSYASSQTLVTQILNGAPADVIVTANTSTMAQLTAKDLVETPQAFCRNKLEIITAPGNPRNITSLADLAKPGISVVLADPSVPVGDYSAKALSMAGVKVTPKSLQLDDAEVVEQVESGNADAALVFVTDIVSAGSRVTGVPIPDAQNVIGTYEVAAVKTSSNLTAARAYIAEVVSGSIHAALLSAGFLAP